jgi:hypothetical protein
MYAFGKHMMRLLFSNQSDVHIEEVNINRYETITQFLLLGLAAYLGFFPPKFFTDLIHSATIALF